MATKRKLYTSQILNKVINVTGVIRLSKMSKNNLIIPQAQRTHADLKRLQALPLQQKIMLFKRRVFQFQNLFDGHVYGAFSGGKDSTMMMNLIWEDFPEIPGVFSNTGLEYPEIVKFVKKTAETNNVEIVRPKMSFKQVIDKKGWAVVSKVQSMAISRYRNTKDPLQKEYRTTGCKNGEKIGMAGVISKKHQYLIDAPFKISEGCCDALKKSPFKVYQRETGRKPIIGTMAEESELRLSQYIKHGCNMLEKGNPMSAPMSFFTEQDVLNYFRLTGKEYCSVYGDIAPTKEFLQMDMFGADDEAQKYTTTGEKRTGCMWCMFGLEQETLANNGENRFTRMRKTHPKQWDAVVNKYGGKEVLEFMNLPYK